MQIFARDPSDFCASVLALIRSRWLGGTASFTAATIGPALLILGDANEARAQACIGFPVQTNQTCTNSTTLTNTSTDGGGAAVGLQDAGTLTLTNTLSGTITGTDRGVLAASTANVSNAGTIQGTAADSRGIAAGTVNVTANTGTISGGFRGIRADTANVTNSGTIQATGTDGSAIFTFDSATVTNSGLIAGLGNGILSLNTSNVTNLGTGTIAGTSNGSFGINTVSTMVNNAGLIFGLAGGINATTTADVTNSGTIQGTASSSFGIGADSLILKNTGLGLISGVEQGLNINTTANVTNSGTIQATSATGFGIFADTATVTNSGTISGGSRGISAATSNITNELSGTISGGFRGVRAVTANVTNYGLIQGTDAGSAGLFANTVGVTNHGIIQSLGSNGFGIQSLGAVTGTNYATIQGTAAGSQGIDAASVDMTNSGTISGVAGGINATTTVNMTNSNIIQGTGSNSFGIQATSAVVTNSGTISGAAKGIAVTGTVNVTNTLTGFISGAERGIEATNAGNTAATVSNAGIIQGTAADSRGIAADSVTVTSNTGMISGGFRGIRATTANVTNLSSGTIQATGANGSGIFVFDMATVTNSGFITGPANGIQSINAANVTNSGIISGLVGIDVAGASSVTNSGTITGSGGTAILFGATGNTLTLAPGSIVNGTAHGFGADTFQLGGTGSDALNAGLFATQFSGYTTFNKIGASTWTLTGTNPAALPWTISGGTLLVDATLSNSAMTVTAGGTLGGVGTVGTTAINGGALAPGHAGIGTLNVQGSLTFTTAAAYLVQVSSTASDLTTVAGAATLAGTVQVTSPTNSYRFNSPYTILTSASLGGTQFNSLSLPTGINGSITYVGGTTVVLNLTSVLGTLPGLNGNQGAVGNALDTALNAGGALGSLGAIFTGNIAQNLTQVSGELATGSQQATFNAMNQFLGVITDPFITGRGDPLSGGGSPNAYADETMAYAAKGKGRSASEREAYAAVYAKSLPLAPSFAQRWSVWAAGFGGSQRTDGNAFVGSNDTRSSLYGVAVGADYRLSPNTIAGFALAGGGTNFSVNNLGSGRSDLFQAGGFIRHNVGAAYLTGALAYGWQDITTDRTVTVAGLDQLHARFSANAWSGRVEGGYRFAAQGFGITPYAAGQFTTFELPNYMEQAVVGANTFALTYNAKSVTDTRSELGIRTDKSFAMADGILTLRGRFAWAHDFNPDRNIAATFLALPGASFVVNGAAMAPDAALVTAALEKKWLNGWSAAATFEGEFSNVTRSYAGKGIVRYVW